MESFTADCSGEVAVSFFLLRIYTAAMPNTPPMIEWICGISFRKIQEPRAAEKGTRKIKLLALLAPIFEVATK